MLVQLHAQNPKNTDKTEFLMQGEVDSDEQAQAWFKLCQEKWEEFKGQIQEGWVPMVCTETSDHFMWAAPNREPE